MYQLIPNVRELELNLARFAEIINADEVEELCMTIWLRILYFWLQYSSMELSEKCRHTFLIFIYKFLLFDDKTPNDYFICFFIRINKKFWPLLLYLKEFFFMSHFT